MPLTLQLYKAHTHSLLQAHIMIAGGAALLFAKMEWLMCDCCLSPAEAVCSSLRCCQRWYAFFSWTHKFRTQSALIIVLLYRLPRTGPTRESFDDKQVHSLLRIHYTCRLMRNRQWIYTSQKLSQLFSTWLHATSHSKACTDLLLHLSTHRHSADGWMYQQGPDDGSLLSIPGPHRVLRLHDAAGLILMI